MRGLRACQHQVWASLCVAAFAAATIATIAPAASGGIARPPHSDPTPSCLETAKVRGSTSSKPFNVTYRLRCDFNVNRVILRTTKQLTRVQTVPTVDPSSAGSFRCAREKPRKVACSGSSGPRNALVTIMLRVKPGPCKKPRLKLSGTTRGIPSCTSGGPCVEPIVSTDLSARVSGC